MAKIFARAVAKNLPIAEKFYEAVEAVNLHPEIDADEYSNRPVGFSIYLKSMEEVASFVNTTCNFEGVELIRCCLAE